MPRGNMVLSPDVLAEHTTLLASPTEGRPRPPAQRGRGSRSPSPTSRRGGERTGSNLADRRRSFHPQRGAGGKRSGDGGDVSPVRSGGGDGSTSSQARGFKRLTRRLSFRQRQAQANLQVCGSAGCCGGDLDPT